MEKERERMKERERNKTTLYFAIRMHMLSISTPSIFHGPYHQMQAKGMTKKRGRQERKKREDMSRWKMKQWGRGRWENTVYKEKKFFLRKTGHNITYHHVKKLVVSDDDKSPSRDSRWLWTPQRRTLSRDALPLIDRRHIFRFTQCISSESWNDAIIMTSLSSSSPVVNFWDIRKLQTDDAWCRYERSLLIFVSCRPHSSTVEICTFRTRHKSRTLFFKLNHHTSINSSEAEHIIWLTKGSYKDNVRCAWKYIM